VHVERTHAGLVEHTIKQLKYERSGAFLMPLSSDPRYQEKIKFEGDQEFNDIRIAGVVIGVFQTV
jgi:phage repressor protein C with HTH and peptisase S24 domain